MRVIMISSDKSICDAKSSAAARQARYGACADEVHIIIFTPRGFSSARIGNNVFAHPTNSREKWGYIPGAIFLARRIAKEFPKGERVLISAQDPFESGLAAWLAAKTMRASLQLQLHTDAFSPHFATGSLMNRIRVFLARFLLPRADCIRAVSARVKDSVVRECRIPEGRIAVLPIRTFLPSRADEGFLKKTYPHYDFFVLAVGRLSPEKDFPLAITAFAKAARRHSHCALVIAGDGPERGALQKIARDAGVGERVFFAGHRNNLAPFYASADMFLFTSRYEGYGCALVEAAAAGLPIVTTDVGAVGETITKERALVCPVGDEKCLSRNILNIIENKNLRAHLGKEARGVRREIHSEEEYFRAHCRLWRGCA